MIEEYLSREKRFVAWNIESQHTLLTFSLG